MRFRLCLCLCLLTGCDAAGTDNILSIDADATVQGVVFFDVNGTRELEDDRDRGAADIPVALVLAGTADTVARVNTGSGGEFLFADVPVGRYRVVIPGSVLGDSIGIVYASPPGRVVEGAPAPVDSTVIVLGVEDTATVELGIGYPRVTIEQARALEPGRKVFVRGVATTTIGTLGDTALYIASGSAALRITNAATANVFIGDTVHVLGTTGTSRGQPVLEDGTVYILAAGELPTPIDIGAEEARSARGGSYDAALVSVEGLVVQDTATVDEFFLITGDGGSANLEILFQPNASYDLTQYGPGATLDVSGILVPVADGSYWQLRPRSGDDIVAAQAAPRTPDAPAQQRGGHE